MAGSPEAPLVARSPRRTGSGFGYEPRSGRSVEWYTPPAVFAALGPLTFDLDPAAPPGGVPARRNFSRADDGLVQNWSGTVWLNPPYDRSIGTWLERLAGHGDGIALVFARSDTVWFHRTVPAATAVCFIAGAWSSSALTLLGSTACCARCGAVIREGRETVYRHTPREVRWVWCARADADSKNARPSVRWVAGAKRREVGMDGGGSVAWMDTIERWQAAEESRDQAQAQLDALDAGDRAGLGGDDAERERLEEAISAADDEIEAAEIAYYREAGDEEKVREAGVPAGRAGADLRRRVH